MVAPRSPVKSPLKTGFTLIEISIVLVIIGLIIGGVLVGRDLINIAALRATISQIEKYNAAVNTFRGKYGYLPGDIPEPIASESGLTPRGQYAGEGDGNGVLEANFGNGTGENWGNLVGCGETGMFWVDLTYANGFNLGLVEGNFQSASPTNCIFLGEVNPNPGNPTDFFIYNSTVIRS